VLRPVNDAVQMILLTVETIERSFWR